jgi:DNA polymerase-3 subunit epsilon
MDFVAIDLETSNSDMSSICQIGVASFSNGALVGEWSTLLNPETHFDEVNVSIHGITAKAVANSPTFLEMYKQLESLLKNSIVVSHTHFDRVSLDKAIRKNQLDPIEVTWLDSAKVARRTWEECSHKGYGLSKVCKIIDYDFKHHDALEDAKACGAVLIAAIEKTGMDLDGWLTRVGQPIITGATNGKTLSGNPEGALFGQTIVFTGALDIPRKEAALLASKVGCEVTASVTKRTNLLVVGDQDITVLAGKNKSSKHIKAEHLIRQGIEIRILKESDFKELVEITDNIEK